MGNQTNACRDIELLFNSSSCDLPPPDLMDCEKMILIYRLMQFDCYMKRLFFLPTAAILVFFGTILNLFSLYCFLKMNKRNSQNVHLSVLSLSDTINLQINFTIPLLRQFESIDHFFQAFKIICQVNGFLTEFFLIFPTWIVVLLTFERFICVLLPFQRYSLFTHTRAKVSIVILAFSVMCLCIYRFFDLKGIDQVSVFTITACEYDSTNSTNGTNWVVVQSINLTIWAILPEILTLIMSVNIIYNIKLATQQFGPFYSKVRQKKFSQATKTVLLISILFLTCHTPTGITIILHLFYFKSEQTVGITMLFVSRKITVLLYEISLSCKFFIYNRTFRNFKCIFDNSLTRFKRQTNSAKLGRPVLCVKYKRNQHAKIFQFGPIKNNHVYQAKETVALARQQHKTSSKTSTSTSRASREQQKQQQQLMTATTMKTNVDMQVSLFETPNLLRRYTTDTKGIANNRFLWRGKPQITL